MLLTHPKIYLDHTGARTDALLVREGRVLATGERARELARPSDGELRPEGACLFPALADAHIHTWGLGQRAGIIDLRQTSSPGEVYARLRQADPNGPASEWVEGHGWDQFGWEGGETLELHRLDAIYPDRPVLLYRVDRHAAWANSEALRRAQVTPATEPPGGGQIVKDLHGRLTGLVIDEAVSIVTRVIPPPGRAELREVFEHNARELVARGVTSAHMAWTSVDGVRMAQELWQERALPIRLHCMIDVKDPELGELLEQGPHLDEDAELSWCCLKYFADGAMGSQGALMLEPYLSGDVGLEVTSREVLLEQLPAHLERGWQVAVHAIGDRAARAVLDAFEAASPEARRAQRPRLEHAQIMAPEDITRMGPLGVVASVQPIHLYSDSPWAHRVLRDHQLERLYNWRDLQAATTLAAGSDFPIDDHDPWRGMATFLHRVNARGQAWRPEQTITRAQAMAAYTEGAAWAARWERQLGKLREGWCADALALDRDPFEVDPQGLAETQVLRVWCGGAHVALPQV